MESSRELQCVGKLEIAKPKPVGFLCGSIPVPTDKAFHSFSSALIPSRQTVSAPRYRMLPTETDLNSPPLVPNLPEKVLPIATATPSRGKGDLPWDVGTSSSNLVKKCEALAVYGVAEYGDEIDVISPADTLKQIFKIPYSKARVSIAVQRVGQTLILNPGPDVEEGENFIRRHNSQTKNQTKSADQSLFLNFAMHSVRMEACDCPPTHSVPSKEQSNSSVLNTPKFVGKHEDVVDHEESNSCSRYSQYKQNDIYFRDKKNKRNTTRDPVKKVSQVGEKPRSTVQESEKNKRPNDNGFLRVLFWQFHNFRMLLGSDLMLFSNEKYVAISLHLWDVAREITPMTWLEAWLDNVMASVPELAICYHRNGVVQGYELIKTDDIFLSKGISEDGNPAFHPYVIQQNGLSVLRFLEENCKQEPGAYWLYKSAGEDVIQLFDLSAISKNRSSNDTDDCSSSVPSIVHRRSSDSLHSLGTFLYRIAHRLSLSMTPDKRAKCAVFIKKCFEFLEEPEDMVVRAFAHEQFARLILNYDEELDLKSEVYRKFEIVVSDAEEESSSYFLSIANDLEKCDNFTPVTTDDVSPHVAEIPEDLVKDISIKTTIEANALPHGEIIELGNEEIEESDEAVSSSFEDKSRTVIHHHVGQTTSGPISSKLAAIHHVSQAIKSLRWMRQFQSMESETEDWNSEAPDPPRNFNDVSVCACGDPDCIEVCNIREWLPSSKMDHKLWKLVLLLGESYLALGQAYKESQQLHRALKVAELACSVYGSMPQHLNDSRFISSMSGSSSPLQKNISAYHVSCLTTEQCSSVYLFWANAWMLVGDIFVENYMVNGNDISKEEAARELKVSSEVVKEVKRLKNKLGDYMQNCSSCSLVNCSCRSDRADSGSSASSRSGGSREKTLGRKHGRKLSAKSKTNSLLEDYETESCKVKAEQRESSQKLIGTVNSFESNKAENDHATREVPKDKYGGIFKYLKSPLAGDIEYLLSIALCCYDEARNALGGLSSGSEELQAVVKKIGWVCNELGRYRLGSNKLERAEIAFTDAIKAFREVSDHTNIILINCNLGHGRRALAEAMVSKIDDLRAHGIFQDAYKHSLENAKLEYRESLRYYGAAKLELNTVAETGSTVSSSLRTEVCTQFAHTYLRLGMFLAREDTSTEIYGNEIMEDEHSYDRRTRKDVQKYEISANDAIREALSTYEALGDSRKQEAAFAHFQLACHQRDCCLKFLESVQKKSGFSKGESNILQRVKQYASLAERNWQKAADFYGPETHHTMYLTVLIERSALLLNLSNLLRSNTMLESALLQMLEGRKVLETSFDSLKNDHPELHSRFWGQLQMLLKKMLAATISGGSSVSPETSPSSDTGKLREMYGKSLKSSAYSQLNEVYSLWTS